MISDKHISEKSLAAGLTVIIIAGLALAGTNTSLLLDTSDRVQAQEQEQSTAAIRVAAGGGNATAPWTIFVPQRIEIKEGQSVIWHNPTEDAGEPHTVTFVLDNRTMAGVVSPLGVANTTKFISLPPGSNNEPVLLPDTTGGGMNTILAVNARTYEPAVIDSQGNVTFMKPNANYSMIGTEKYINSGWFLPNGLEKEYPGSGNTFTVKFEKRGTYDYLCILHPWMTGSVIVT
jgi:plastocyanin